MQCKIKAFRAALFLITVLFGLSGCGVLPGTSGVDRELKASVDYRHSTAACDGLDLSRADMEPQALRSLIGCLNGNGSIPEMAALVAASRDEELAPITATLNALIFSRPERMYALDESFHSLDNQGALAELFDHLGQATSHGSFVPAGIRLMEDGFFSGGSILEYIANGFALEPNEELLKAVEIIANEIDTKDVEDFLDLAVTFTSAKAYTHTQSHFRSNAIANPRYTLDQVTAGLVRFVRSGRDSENDLLKTLLELFKDGSAWEFLDFLIDDSQGTDWAHDVPRWSALFRELLADNGRFLRVAPSFFSALEATVSSPITCMHGTAELESIPPTRIFEELNHQTLWQFLNTVVLSRPFCDFDPAILTGADALFALSSTPSQNVLVSWIRKLNENPRMIRLLIDALGQSDEHAGRLSHLIPLLISIDEREALDDVILLASRIKVSNRSRVKGIINFWLKERDDLDGKSLYGVFLPVVQRINTERVTDLFRALTPFVDEDRETLAPLVKLARRAYYDNDQHPVFETLHELAKNARAHKNTIAALFKIAARNPGLLARTLEEFSKLSRPDNGGARSVLMSFFRLFRHTSERGRFALHPTREPGIAPWLARHDLTHLDLVRPADSVQRIDSYSACRAYDLNFSISEYADPLFSERFSDLTDCITRTYEDEDLGRSLRFLADSAITEGALSERSLFSWTVDLVTSFSDTYAVVRDLVGRSLTALRDGRIRAVIDAIPHWTDRGDRSLIASLLSILREAYEAPSLSPETTESRRARMRQELLAKQARICKLRIYSEFDEDEGFDVIRRKMECESLPMSAAIVRQLERWEPGADVNARTGEIIAEYVDSVLHDRAGNEGAVPTELSRTDFLQRFSHLTTGLINGLDPANPHFEENTHKPLLGLLRFLKTLNPQMSVYSRAYKAHPRFTPDELYPVADQLTDWMIEQANIFTVMPYYYRGATNAKVRLVNNLDRLALILENADFVVPPGLEMGIVGITNLPLTWEDEPMEDRPAFARDENVTFTLSQTVDALTGAIPEVSTCNGEPVCASKTFNLKGYPWPGSESTDESVRYEQPGLTSMFYEYLPENRVCNTPFSCFGLRIVRNLFSSVHEATPDALRQNYGGLSEPLRGHNIKIVRSFFQTGVMRRAGVLLFGKERNDSEIRDFFRTAIVLAHHERWDLIEETATTLLDLSQRGAWNENLPREEQSLLQRVFTVGYEASDSVFAGPMGFYAVAAIERLGLLESPTDLLDPALRVTIGAARPDSPARRILHDRAELIRTVFASEFLARLLQTTYRSTANGSSSHWADFKSRLQQMRRDPNYPRADLERLTDGIIDYLHNPPLGSADETALYRRGFEILANQIESGETEALLRLMGGHTSEIENLTQTISRLSRQGDLHTTLDTVERLLRETN